ncbi:hypothetical protein B296_00000007 [Ensete ventricosum]|uniref:Uncharacterized protein n=1 Tax=Ensete ventricosum TaxID=4639 RepID=A0A427ASV6_ENSVE|nr:hypothetical protein B296_00000007 [Ensete ventricosum]
MGKHVWIRRKESLIFESQRKRLVPFQLRNKDVIIRRIIENWKPTSVTSIIVAKERHKDKGRERFHIGILVLEGVQKKRAPRLLRQAFPEFERAELYLKCRKGCGQADALYVIACRVARMWLKRTQSQPYGALEDVIAAAKAHEGHQKVPTVDYGKVIQKLQDINERDQVYDEPELQGFVTQSCNNPRAAFEDVSARKEKEESIKERLLKYLNEKGWPQEYTIEDEES